jgi:hypothetical protein
MSNRNPLLPRVFRPALPALFLLASLRAIASDPMLIARAQDEARAFSARGIVQEL